jgi:ATP-dependent exoDNAse (exonuclease V) beta subunit
MNLAQLHPHPRDQRISFKEETHEYTIEGFSKKPISVTTLVHHFFEPFVADKVIKEILAAERVSPQYEGKSHDQIAQEWKEATNLGTKMHENIELFLNQITPHQSTTKEFSMFRKFYDDLCRQYPTLNPYRTEWVVYDIKVGVAGSIDLVLSDSQGNLVIVDWKRSRKIRTQGFKGKRGFFPFGGLEDCNYFHYSLQLNFYRQILEKNYGKKVIYMMLVILHPDQENYLCFPVDFIDLSLVWSLLEHRDVGHGK